MSPTTLRMTVMALSAGKGPPRLMLGETRRTRVDRGVDAERLADDGVQHGHLSRRRIVSESSWRRVGSAPRPTSLRSSYSSRRSEPSSLPRTLICSSYRARLWKPGPVRHEPAASSVRAQLDARNVRALGDLEQDPGRGRRRGVLSGHEESDPKSKVRVSRAVQRICCSSASATDMMWAISMSVSGRPSL